MRAHRLPAVIGATVLLSVGLTGCVPLLLAAPHAASSAPTAEPSVPAVAESTPSAEPSAPASEIETTAATGDVVKGSAYSIHVPKGWGVPKNGPDGVDLFAASRTPSADGYSDNVNVLAAEATGASLDETEAGGVDYLEQVVGATEVMVRPRVVVDGVDTLHISDVLDTHGVHRWTEQYLVVHEGIAYTVTFTFFDTPAVSSRETIAESMLASWKWA